MNVLNKTTCALLDYKMSAEIETHKKDGKQQLQISFIASGRLFLLRAQLLDLFTATSALHYPLIGVCVLPAGIGIANAVLSYFVGVAKKEVENVGAEPVSFYATLCDAAEKLSFKGKEFSQESNKWVNTACLVSSCAMLVFGHPLSAAIGVASLLLINLKINEDCSLYLFDRALDPLIFAASVAEGWSMLSSGLSFEGLMIVLEGFDISKRFELPYPIKAFIRQMSERISHLFEVAKEKINLRFVSAYG